MLHSSARVGYGRGWFMYQDVNVENVAQRVVTRLLERPGGPPYVEVPVAVPYVDPLPPRMQACIRRACSRSTISDTPSSGEPFQS